MQWVFQFGRAYLWKNREIYSWIKICSSKKVEKIFKILVNDLFFFCFVFSINFLNLKTNHFFFFDRSLTCDSTSLYIRNTSYTSENINHSNWTDCPKYLNKNQALFRHKNYMTAELYLVYILGIEANWENWKKIPQTTWDTQKIFLCKFLTPHWASDKVFRLIFIQSFYVINLIWWSIF